MYLREASIPFCVANETPLSLSRWDKVDMAENMVKRMWWVYGSQSGSIARRRGKEKQNQHKQPDLTRR